MKKRLYAAALALGLSGGVVALAQSATTQTTPAPAEQNRRMERQDMNMNMSGMMSCCAQMQERMRSGARMECPMMSGNSNDATPRATPRP